MDKNFGSKVWNDDIEYVNKIIDGTCMDGGFNIKSDIKYMGLKFTLDYAVAYRRFGEYSNISELIETINDIIDDEIVTTYNELINNFTIFVKTDKIKFIMRSSELEEDTSYNEMSFELPRDELKNYFLDLKEKVIKVYRNMVGQDECYSDYLDN